MTYEDPVGHFFATLVQHFPPDYGYGTANLLCEISPSFTSSYNFYFFPPEPQSPYLFRPVFPLGGVIAGPDGNLYGTSEAGGASGHGTVYELVREPPVAAPTLSATSNTNAVDLTWTPAVDATGYNVYLGQAPAGEAPVPYAVGITASHYSIPRLKAGTPYYVKVTPVNLAGSGPQSNEASATPHSAQSFSQGLRFFSMPYDYTGITLDSMFGYSGVVVASWDTVHSQYKLTPDPSASTVHLGAGYWARFPKSDFLHVDGKSANANYDFTIKLASGWNAIGNPFFRPIDIQTLTFDNGAMTFAQATAGSTPLIGATVYGYDPSANNGGGGYVAAQSIDPRQGYWIWSSKAVDMRVPHP